MAPGMEIDVAIRVHDLPDYVYFNHSAHVNRGVGCVECHGRIDKMEVVYQAEPLSMGWCLECHRAPEQHLRPLEDHNAECWRDMGRAAERVGEWSYAQKWYRESAAALPFEARFGRTSMEYYDGFVFGFTHPARPDLPAAATGGRYDALTRALGGAEASAAVGGVIRPGLLVETEGGA